MYKETQANVYNNFWVYKKQTGVPLEYTLYIRVRNNDNRKAVWNLLAVKYNRIS